MTVTSSHKSTEQFARLNGVECCYQTFGDSSSTPIALIAGAGCSMLHWRDGFCARLAQAGRYVIRYDNRDTGRSSHFPPGKPPYELPDLVNDAVGLLSHLGLEKAHVVGMSMGAAVAQLLALEHPGLVASLTLMSGTPGGPGHDSPDLPSPTDRIAGLFTEEQEEVNWSDFDSAVDAYVEGERPFAAASASFDVGSWRELAERDLPRNMGIGSTLVNHFVMSPGQPWRQRLSELAVPTLVMHGEEDPLFPLEHGKALAKEIEGARLIELAAVGHELIPRRTWDQVQSVLLNHTGFKEHASRRFDR